MNVIEKQYQTAKNLNTRISIHDKYSTNHQPFGDWIMCFPGGSDGKESACNTGDLGSIPGWGISPGEGNGNPFQYSCLENSSLAPREIQGVPVK